MSGVPNLLLWLLTLNLVTFSVGYKDASASAVLFNVFLEMWVGVVLLVRIFFFLGSVGRRMQMILGCCQQFSDFVRFNMSSQMTDC